jgi:hypothetical protein
MSNVLLAEIFYEGSFNLFIVYMIVGMYCLHRLIKRNDPTGRATNAAARGLFSWLFGRK